MKFIKVYRYAAYPNEKQARLINQTFGACRLVWNWALDLYIAHQFLKKLKKIKFDDLLKFLILELNFLLSRRTPNEVRNKIKESSSLVNLKKYIAVIEINGYFYTKSTKFNIIKAILNDCHILSSVDSILEKIELDFNLKHTGSWDYIISKLPALKKQYVFLTNSNAQALVAVIRGRLAAAVTRCYKDKRKFGFPKFKRFSYDSSFDNQNDLSEVENTNNFTDRQTKNRIIDLNNGFALLYLQKFNDRSLKPIKIQYHRQLPKNCLIKNVCIAQKATLKYEACITLQYERNVELIYPDNPIGMDKNFRKNNHIVLSDGRTVPYPVSKDVIDPIEKQIKHYDKKLQSKRNHNVNYRKSKKYEFLRIKRAKLYKRLSDLKNDKLHKFTHNYVSNSNYNVFCHEDLNVKGMAKTQGKSVSQCSFFEIKRQIDYKAQEVGKSSVTVGRFFPSSKKCNKCGYVNPKLKRTEENWTCSKCRTNHHRDKNAAVNIKIEGFGIAKKQYQDRMKELSVGSDNSTINNAPYQLYKLIR